MEALDSVIEDIVGESSEVPEEEVKAFEEATGEENAPQETAPEQETAPQETAKEETSETASEPKVEARNDSVPLAVFLEQKNELKELRRQIEEVKNPPKVEEEAPAGPPEFKATVAYDDDPAEYLRQENAHLRSLSEYNQSQIENVSKKTDAQVRQQETQARVGEFINAVDSSESAFRAINADYDDAVSFLRETRSNQLRAISTAQGQEVTPQLEAQINQHITQEFAKLALAQIQSGRDPAAVLYQVAAGQGYKRDTSSEEKLERVEKGVKSSVSSASTPGFTNNPPVEEADDGDFLAGLQKEAGYRR